MPNLQDILYKANLTEVIGTTDKEIEEIHYDSREVVNRSIFVAVRGLNNDGHQFIPQAIENGASTIICEEIPGEISNEVTYIKIKNTAEGLGILAANFYDNPSEKVKLIGVTGTNGKSTTATLLFNLFKSVGFKVGLISTIENRVNDIVIPVSHTTPEATKINAYLSEMADTGCEFCFMEVSSHAIDQRRIAGLSFAGGVFTNISHEHLDYHVSMRAYIKVKKQFFDNLTSRAFALTNIDDKQGHLMLQNTKAKKYTYSLRSMADFKGKVLENTFTGLVMLINDEEMYSQLVGEFNAYNLLAVYGVAMILGQDKMDTLTTLSTLKTAEGRFETQISERKKVIGIIDYAHTPDALNNVLSTIKKLRTGNEKVITIVGCGGDRDRSKRPVMAEVACEYSDKVIFTSDNPRPTCPSILNFPARPRLSFLNTFT